MLSSLAKNKEVHKLATSELKTSEDDTYVMRRLSLCGPN